MKYLFLLTLAALSLGGPAAASAQDLRRGRDPGCHRALVRFVQRGQPGRRQNCARASPHVRLEFLAGYLPSECWGRDTSIKVVGSFSTSIPDMKFDIKEVLVAGDRVVVRGEVTGTPAGALFGAAHTGKSFRMMTIDIQTIKDGKIAKTYHIENWLSALGQLRAQ